MKNLIIIAVLALVIGGIVLYVYKAKKRGQKCIGCPYADSCPSGGGCSCNGTSKNKKTNK